MTLIPDLPGRWLVALCVITLLPLAGCSTEDERSDCGDEDIPVLPDVPDTAVHIGQFRVESRVTIGLDGKRTTQNVASLALIDTSEVERVPRTPDQQFSETCFALTGAPFERCREGFSEPCVRKQLSVDKVEVTGIPGGLTLNKQTEGNYSAVDVADPLFGSDSIELKVTGKDAADFFPSYQQKVAPPDGFEITQLGPDPIIEGKPLPALSGRDLPIHWTGSNGRFVEITVQVDKQGETDKVVCLVVDDGCHTIPASAFDWLALNMGPDDHYKMSITRQLVEVDVLDADTQQVAAEIKSARRMELTLEQTSAP